MSESTTIPTTSKRLKEKEDQKTKKQPPYHVILLNDDDHSYDYVIRMLQQLFGHPRDPYSRIDVYKTTRHVRVLLDGELLADTRRAQALFETGLPTRYYIPREDVVAEVEPSDRHTTCPYKGVASYYTVGGNKDIAWYYPDPLPGVEPIKDLVAFWNERAEISSE